MSLSCGRDQMYSALKTLRVHWEETKFSWDDSVRRGFEEGPWNLLESHVVGALKAMDRLSQILTKMEQEIA
jgi:hypothetical protein